MITSQENDSIFLNILLYEAIQSLKKSLHCNNTILVGPSENWSASDREMIWYLSGTIDDQDISYHMIALG